MKRNPDDRSDNAEKIIRNINSTKDKMEAADELIEKTDNPMQKNNLTEKNKRRACDVNAMRGKLCDERNETGDKQ